MCVQDDTAKHIEKLDYSENQPHLLDTIFTNLNIAWQKINNIEHLVRNKLSLSVMVSKTSLFTYVF